MKLDVTVENERMTVRLSGRLAVDTATVLEELIDHQLANIKELILDFGAVDYVSSVGLRAILKAQQKMKELHGSFLLKNVTKPIADLFDMTGLDRILHFERKPREISIAGLEMIAKGANGECYKVDDETVVKLYFDFVKEASALKEKELAKQAFVAGVPTPISFDVVECGNRRGIMYEMIKADTLSKYIEKNVDRLDAVVEMYVGFCKQIHSIVPAPNIFPDALTLACGYVDACDFSTIVSERS
ncbi:MAG: STAS domain-containing protein [Planctomycetota bacterium]|nr:STAS domain-containing protein [Planctomycetota bacterium]